MPAKANISIIVPAFNAANYIDKCLESILNQEVKPLEIIVVDNGSTDDTLTRIHQYEDIVVLSEIIPGASKARNRGAKEAKGKILAFIDSDCQAEQDWIKEAWNTMNNQESIDGLVGFSTGINQNIWAYFFQRSYNDFPNEIQDYDGRLLKIDTKNFFIKREIFLNIGGLDTSIGRSEDVDLGIRLHQAGYHIEYVTTVRVLHLNPIDLSSRLLARFEENFFDYKIFRKIPFKEGIKYYPAFNRWYSRYIFTKNPPPSRFLFYSLKLIVGMCRYMCSSLLLVLNHFGLSKSLYPLYHFLMALTAFQGKLYARMIDVGYIDFEIARRRFSRRFFIG
jgi:glycosyltransferase involved in cell wall biosynthesis